MEFKTPSGYIIRLKRNYLTYGEKVEIQKLFLKSSKIDTEKQSIKEIDSLVIFEANKLAFNYLVDSIITPENREIKENLYDFVMNMREEDGQEIFNKINEFINPNQNLEKKSY